MIVIFLLFSEKGDMDDYFEAITKDKLKDKDRAKFVQVGFYECSGRFSNVNNWIVP